MNIVAVRTVQIKCICSVVGGTVFMRSLMDGSSLSWIPFLPVSFAQKSARFKIAFESQEALCVS